MKRRPPPANQARMDGGPVQLSMLAEWRDLSSGQQPDPVAQEQERRAAAPLPGQPRLVGAQETGA